jgi:hypothetical protein
MTEGALVCEKHPNRETSLRCNRCEKPICSECAVLTPVGYRCQDCVRSQQSGFDTARNIDYLIAFVVALVGVGVGIYLLSFLGFWGFFLAPVIGGGTAEILRRLINNRRSRRLPLAAIIGGVIGALPHLFTVLIALVSTLLGGYGLTALGSVAIAAIWPIGFAFLIISTLYYRIRGISL